MSGRKLPDKTIQSHKDPDISSKSLFIFELEWTLMKPKNGRECSINDDDWTWLRKSVPSTLTKISKTHQIVILTDQKEVWKAFMIKKMCLELKLDIVFIVVFNKKLYKPNTTIFNDLFRDYESNSCIMVSDTGGSTNWHSPNKDFADALGFQFKKPEDIFPFDEIPEIIGNFMSSDKEVVILVGMPGSGKSTFCKIHLGSYKILCGDTFKTQNRMIEEAKKYINEYSIIFDGTNGNIQRRQKYVEFALENKCSVKCIWMNTPIDICIEQIKKRKMEGGNYVPKKVLYEYENNFEKPDEKEGFLLLTPLQC